MEAARSHGPPLAISAAGRSARLLKVLSDERLVGRVRSGSEAAFAELYERYCRRILSFSRHMLGGSDEAEDAVQQTFINAYRDISSGEKELRFRPWLYRIARNQCISMLRARRPQAELSDAEPSLVGLSEEVAGREELRGLLRDLTGLPREQREALLLAELHDNSHSEVAEIIGCDREKVKSLVFQARSSLIGSRQAREVSCEEIRRQLGVLRGGALRRSIIRRHLKECEGCRSFQQQVRQQRRALALVLPVVPSAALKFGAANAMAAAGAHAAGGAAASGAAAGGAAAVGAAGGGTPVLGTVSSSLAAVAAKLGVPAVVVKGAAATAVVAAAVGGGTAGVKVTRDVVSQDPKPAAAQPSGSEIEGRTDASAGKRAQPDKPAGAGARAGERKRRRGRSGAGSDRRKAHEAGRERGRMRAGRPARGRRGSKRDRLPGAPGSHPAPGRSRPGAGRGRPGAGLRNPAGSRPKRPRAAPKRPKGGSRRGRKPAPAPDGSRKAPAAPERGDQEPGSAER